MVAAAIVGAAVVGGVATSVASSKAAKAQKSAADTASAAQLEMYNQTREDQAPYREAGYTALKQLGTDTAPGGDFNRDFTIADFQKDPGLEFRRTEGQRGVESSAAARGGLLSGGALKGIDRYNQDYASGEYSNAYNRFNNDRTTRFNRLSSIAGTGQTAVNTTGVLGANVANNIAQNTLEAGNARASGYVGQANAINQTATTLGNYYLNRQYGYQPPPRATGP